MKKAQLALAATFAMGTGLVALPASADAQVHKHHRLATIVGGVGAYELAKHSHNKFAHKHRFAAGLAGAWATHHYMKKHSH